MRTERQLSAGGVAFRREASAIDIAIIRTGPVIRWQLPKGLVDRGESAEMAAVREVREEAGIDAELIAPLEDIDYWYVSTAANGERIRYHKVVRFFLMEYRGGDVADHDHEVEEARWAPILDALALLTFSSERRVVERAADLLAG